MTNLFSRPALIRGAFFFCSRQVAAAFDYRDQVLIETSDKLMLVVTTLYSALRDQAINVTILP